MTDEAGATIKQLLPCSNAEKSDQELSRLAAISREVEAMGHLLKWQQPETLATEDVQAGIGDILEGLGRKLRRSARRLENQIYPSRSRHPLP